MIRPAALLLTVLTGFSGLVYEVTWEKMLATLLGSHSEATAAVLGLFLGGLAAGYALFGRFTRQRLAAAQRAGRPARLLFAYGFVEGGIGLYALVFPLLFGAARALSLALPVAGEGLGFALDVLLSALLILPPSILMGGTIPILTQALAHGLEDATRAHAWIYAFNTAGATVGCLAAGFWIVPALGLDRTVVAMGLLNLAAGGAFLWLGRGAGVQQAAPSVPAPAAPPGFAAYAGIALCVGFAMMCVQTTLIRVGGLSFGASQFVFSTVVGVFVLCIALGSLAVSALRRIPGWLLAADLWALALTLGLLYPLLPDSTYWAHRLRLAFPEDPAAFYPYHLAAFASVLALIGLPVALSGASLPLLFDHLRNRVGELGDVAGRLYSWNTVGSLLGALLGGYALLFWLDLHHVFRLALIAVSAAAFVASLQNVERARRVRLAPLALAPLAVVALLPAWDPIKLDAGLFRDRSARPIFFAGPEAFFAGRRRVLDVLSHDDDPIASVAVMSRELPGGGEDRAIFLNGKSDGSVVGDYSTHSLAVLVPALLADRPERALLVGFGSGVSAGTLAGLDATREITVAEISPAVLEAAPLFERFNGGPLAFPGLRLIRSDAYRALLRSRDHFDVISSIPSNPWLAGVEMLFSRELLQAARDHLAPGGVFSLFLPNYDSDTQTLRLVLRTFDSVFEHSAVWYTTGETLAVLGFEDPQGALDEQRLLARMRQPDVARALERNGIHSPAALLVHEVIPLGALHTLPLEGEIHTLSHPRLGYVAARAFFAGGSGVLPSTAPLETARVAHANSLLRRYLASRGGRLPLHEQLELAEAACANRGLDCATVLAEWRSRVPFAPARTHLEQSIRSNEATAPIVDPQLLAALGGLYGARDGGSAEITTADAEVLTELFAAYYHPALPFSRRALAATWERCGQGPCRAALERVEAVLGPLEQEVGPAEGAPGDVETRAGGSEQP